LHFGGIDPGRRQELGGPLRCAASVALELVLAVRPAECERQRIVLRGACGEAIAAAGQAPRQSRRTPAVQASISFPPSHAERRRLGRTLRAWEYEQLVALRFNGVRLDPALRARRLSADPALQILFVHQVNG